MEIKTIMIVGSGFMGSGIAQVAAQAGYNVILNDIETKFVEKGINSISERLSKKVNKGKLTDDDKNSILSRINGSTNLEDAKAADFVIEAIFENIDAKKDIFQRLDDICKAEVIFASNTSTIPIGQLATAVKRPDKFLGMHFFSPVPVMTLVEITRGLKTSLETIEMTEGVVSRMGKEGVRVKKDVPGFLVNRLNFALRCEAFNLLKEGVASIQDIDKAAKLGLRHPMGPFELSDFVGLDIAYNGIKAFWENYGDTKWLPFRVLGELVANGELGRKTGKGWYDYTSGEQKPRTDIEF